MSDEINTETKSTLNYYDQQAAAFSESTVNVEFSAFQNEFAALVPVGGCILDLGCGSGRDSKAFKQMGYNVVAVDGSKEMCAIAGQVIEQVVICSTFQDYDPNTSFDGIWACASLLHLKAEDIRKVAERMFSKIKSGGCFYMSFKYGTFSGERNGRYFTDLTEDSLNKLMTGIPSIQLLTQKITNDVRLDRSGERWLNAIFKKM